MAHPSMAGTGPQVARPNAGSCTFKVRARTGPYDTVWLMWEHHPLRKPPSWTELHTSRENYPVWTSASVAVPPDMVCYKYAIKSKTGDQVRSESFERARQLDRRQLDRQPFVVDDGWFGSVYLSEHEIPDPQRLRADLREEVSTMIRDALEDFRVRMLGLSTAQASPAGLQLTGCASSVQCRSEATTGWLSSWFDWSFQPEIDAVRDRVHSIKDDLSDHISKLNGDVDTVRQRVHSMQKDLSEHISVHKGDVDTVRKRVKSMQKDLSEHISVHKGDADTVRQRVTAIQKDLSEHISAYRDEDHSLRQSLESMQRDLREFVDPLEVQIARSSQAIHKQRAAFETHTNEVQGQLAAVEQRQSESARRILGLEARLEQQQRSDQRELGSLRRELDDVRDCLDSDPGGTTPTLERPADAAGPAHHVDVRDLAAATPDTISQSVTPTTEKLVEATGPAQQTDGKGCLDAAPSSSEGGCTRAAEILTEAPGAAQQADVVDPLGAASAGGEGGGATLPAKPQHASESSSGASSWKAALLPGQRDGLQQVARAPQERPAGPTAGSNLNRALMHPRPEPCAESTSRRRMELRFRAGSVPTPAKPPTGRGPGRGRRLCHTVRLTPWGECRPTLPTRSFLAHSSHSLRIRPSSSPGRSPLESSRRS
mmetsp:Transcript_55651/g.172474  ORF Transcript_55651/g.172474 Transcript_55651/m.172474 type:complete len:655 (+) Transcript_55651:2-1966(+)